MKKELAIIGVGKMVAVLAPHLAAKFNLHYYAPAGRSARGHAEALAGQIGGTLYDAPQDLPLCDCYLLGVKPQQLAEVVATWQPVWPTGRLLVSLLAGISLESLQHRCKFQQVIRLMPNMAVEVGQGCTALVAAGSGVESWVALWKQALSTSGQIIHCQQERELDLVTIAAGSGPAFFLTFVQAQLDFFQQQKMDLATASGAVVASMQGAAQLINAYGPEKIGELISKVTSKGGVTAAALACWQQQELNSLVIQGLQSAWDRLQQLDQRGEV